MKNYYKWREYDGGLLSRDRKQYIAIVLAYKLVTILIAILFKI
jgi:hypothetical protein